MRTYAVAVAAFAFALLAAVDAEAFNGSRWDNVRGRFNDRAMEKAARRAARRARKQAAIDQGFIQVNPTSLQISSAAANYTSPADPNARNTGSVAHLDVPDANDPGLDADTSSYVAGLETFLGEQLGTALTAKPEPLSFTGIDVTKVKVRGHYNGVKNFTRITGAETVHFEGVLVGGADDGMEVKGVLSLSVKGERAID